MIPKIVFTYWEGDQLSELHYLTIYSLHKYNPELDIIIYTDENPKNILIEWNTPEHSIDIKKKIPLSKLIEINPNKISLIPINFQEKYNFDNNISIVFKADFIRIAKLYEHGGIWFDMDILFVKSIPDFFFNTDIEAFIFNYSVVIPTGFLASISESEYLNKLYKESLEIIKNKELNNYQKIGPIIWKKEYDKLSEKERNKITILDNNFVYPFLWKDLHNLFKSSNETISDITFGVHWYNGDPCTKEYINQLDINNINPDNSLFEALIYKNKII
jgi:mannosyltransferase OCH1-like enzyme